MGIYEVYEGIMMAVCWTSTFESRVRGFPAPNSKVINKQTFLFI